MQFSERVFEARKAIGLTQEQMADRLGVSLRTLSSYENGETEPRGKRRDRLEAKLDELQNPSNGVSESHVDNSSTKSEEALASSLVPSRVEEYEGQLQTIRGMLNGQLIKGKHFIEDDDGTMHLLPQGALKLANLLGYQIQEEAKMSPHIEGIHREFVSVGALVKEDQDPDTATRASGQCSTYEWSAEIDPEDVFDIYQNAGIRARGRMYVNLILAGTAAGEVFER